jgi:hypothetical protein
MSKGKVHTLAIRNRPSKTAFAAKLRVIQAWLHEAAKDDDEGSASYDGGEVRDRLSEMADEIDGMIAAVELLADRPERD